MQTKRIFLTLFMAISLAATLWAGVERIDMRVEGMT